MRHYVTLEEKKKRKIFEGLMSELYVIPYQIADLESEIASLKDRMSSVQAVQYGKDPAGNSMPRDEKLSRYVDSIKQYEDEITAKKVRMKEIIRKLHLNELNEDDKTALKAYINTGSYTEAGAESEFILVWAGC